MLRGPKSKLCILYLDIFSRFSEKTTNQATSHHLNASAVHAGQVSIGGQMTQEQMAIAMQHDQNNTQGIDDFLFYFRRAHTPFFFILILFKIDAYLPF